MDNRKKLSAKQMFSEPYCDVKIEDLRNDHTLDIEKFDIGTYRYYTPRQLLHHYQLEMELAQELMNAPKGQRAVLYKSLYDKLFKEVPYHTQILRKDDEESRHRDVKSSFDLCNRYLRSDSTFLEIGPGDCQLSLAIAKQVKQVYAIDVSEEITKDIAAPSNFELKLSDGSSIDVPPESVDVAFSNQLMEHLHPEDAVAQLTAIYKALAPGGLYICVTPHRFGGPADVSRFFDNVASGFHLKEYTNAELYKLFKTAGFSSMSCVRRIRGRPIEFPLWPVLALETLIGYMPQETRRRLFSIFKKVLYIRVIARK